MCHSPDADSDHSGTLESTGSTAPGTRWHILALKYDQRRHYRLPAEFVADDGTCLRLRAAIGAEAVHWSRGKTWRVARPTEFIFWREQWFNIYLNYDAAGRFDHFYCNIAQPPTITSEACQVMFVDLDLDLHIWPNGAFRVLDGDDFAHNKVALGYPHAVQRAAGEAVLDVVARLLDRVWPFDRVPR